jgi:hypothetical protein
MVNEALLVFIWALDAAAIAGVIWLLTNEAAARPRPPSENRGPSESGQAREPETLEARVHQTGAQAPSSQARTSGSTRGPISASTRA